MVGLGPTIHVLLLPQEKLVDAPPSRSMTQGGYRHCEEAGGQRGDPEPRTKLDCFAYGLAMTIRYSGPHLTLSSPPHWGGEER
jgi:hypothetical protein